MHGTCKKGSGSFIIFLFKMFFVEVRVSENCCVKTVVVNLRVVNMLIADVRVAKGCDFDISFPNRSIAFPKETYDLRTTTYHCSKRNIKAQFRKTLFMNRNRSPPQRNILFPNINIAFQHRGISLSNRTIACLSGNKAFPKRNI